MPKLKSAHKSDRLSKIRNVDPDDISYDISNILDCIDGEGQEYSENPRAGEYEIHSDIEDLIRHTAEIRRREEEEAKKGRRKKHSNDEEKSRKRRKHGLKKTIRFSFSKPASPQTEQVIRVDVTSNISVEELRQIESSRSDTRTGNFLIHPYISRGASFFVMVFMVSF